MKLDRSDRSITRIIVDDEQVAHICAVPVGWSLRWYDRDWREPGYAEIHPTEAAAIESAQARIDREPDLAARLSAATRARRKTMGYSDASK